MPQQARSTQTHGGRDVQASEAASSKTSTGQRAGSQTGSTGGSSTSLDERQKQGGQNRNSQVTRGATRSTATRSAVTSISSVLTPSVDQLGITREDVGVNFSLEIEIELGNMTDLISRT